MANSALSQLRTWWARFGWWSYVAVGCLMLWTARRLMRPVADPPPAQPGTNPQTPKEGGYSVQTYTPPAASGVDSETAAKRMADASALAYYFATDGSKAKLNQAAAFSLLKQFYSRLLLFNNRPYRKVGTTYETQYRETGDSLKRGDNWTVLAPYYRTVTGGNDLKTDIRKYLTDKAYQALLIWII